MDLTTLGGLALSTLVSEDLASIGAGLLARDGQLPLWQAVAACVVGVYLGDLGLWCAGRWLGRRLLARPWASRALSPARLATLGPHIDERLGSAVVISRFVPGSRLPLYVAAGIWGRRPLAFVAWTLVAVLIWTPLLVASTAIVGNSVVAAVLQGTGTVVPGLLVTGGAMWGLLRLSGRLAAALGFV
jgi:membrane protein DedA with SNARE-associated domain